MIAISGTVLADRLRTRHEDGRGVVTRRREVYLQVFTAAGTSHTQLPALAQYPTASTQLAATSRAALTDASRYKIRERFFIDASFTVAGAGQTMFDRLR